MADTKPELTIALKEEKRRYRNLLERAQKYANEVYHVLQTRTIMFRYPKESITNSSWNLKDLYERTLAAQQLGYRVILTVDDKGLLVEYEKKLKGGVEYFY